MYILCGSHVVLDYTKNLASQELQVFEISITIQNFRALRYVALVLLPLHKVTKVA
jgi:hypothetical protein